jgi:cytoskeletal protein RodZ
MVTHVNKKPPKQFLWITLVLLLVFSCSKTKLVYYTYYTPSNTSKSAINHKSIPPSVSPVLQLKTVAFTKDSPTTPVYDTLTNKSKKYSFSDTDTKATYSKPSKTNNNSERKGRYVLLIVGLVMLLVGSLWLFSISNRSPSNYESLLNGCVSLILSLALTTAGLVTTIVGVITAAIN